jgi:hypothetical protein
MNGTSLRSLIDFTELQRRQSALAGCQQVQAGPTCPEAAQLKQSDHAKRHLTKRHSPSKMTVERKTKNWELSTKHQEPRR